MRYKMAANQKRKHHRRKKKKGNWFTRLKTWQKVLICFAGVLVCLSLSAGIYVAAKWSKIDTREIGADDLIINREVKQNAELDLGEGYTNIALFGVDSRDGNLGEGNRTDCIIVASLNNETKEVRMVSVYRDTLLDLSDGSYQKCNAAYSYGGPVQAINMLNMNLDLDIQDYVTVDFGAIADAIDLLGGVEIDVKDEELQYLNKYINETARSAGKEAHPVEKSGLQLLDGTQATTYARIRSTAGGDFTRTERQRLVIEKMVEKAKSADLLTINNIIDKVFPQVSTSLTLSEILNYAAAYSEYKLTENEGFPFDQTTDTISGLGSIVIPQDLASNVTKLHEFLFGTDGYSPSSTVQTLSANIASRVSSAGGSSYTDSSGYSDSSSYNGWNSNSYDNSGSGSWDSGSGSSGINNDTGTSGGSSGGTNPPTDSSSGETATPPSSGGSTGDSGGSGSGSGSESGGSSGPSGGSGTDTGETGSGTDGTDTGGGSPETGADTGADNSGAEGQ